MKEINGQNILCHGKESETAARLRSKQNREEKEAEWI